VFVQIALALLALFALYIKRQREQPPRAWTVWLYDIAKQCASMCCAHVGGMVNAIVLNGITHQGDECAWYFISFTVDTTVGVTIAIYAMRAVAHMARDEECRCCACPSLKETGNYGPGKFYPEGEEPSEQYVQGAAFRFDDPGTARRIWCKQMSIWCLITAGARACCGVLMYIVSGVLRHFATFLADLFRGHPHLFLTLVRFHATTFLPTLPEDTSNLPGSAITLAHSGSLWLGAQVMLGCPVGMNLVQVWIQDNILSTPPPHAHLTRVDRLSCLALGAEDKKKAESPVVEGKPASDDSPRNRSASWVDMLHGEAGTPPGGHDRYSESVEVEGEKNQLLDGRESVSDGAEQQPLRGAA